MLELEDLGIAEKFLGMRISCTNEEGYCIDQEQTIEEVLKKNGLTDANSVRLPISGVQVIAGDNDLLKEKAVGLHPVPAIKDFQSIVGSLLWVSLYASRYFVRGSRNN